MSIWKRILHSGLLTAFSLAVLLIPFALFGLFALLCIYTPYVALTIAILYVTVFVPITVFAYFFHEIGVSKRV